MQQDEKTPNNYLYEGVEIRILPPDKANTSQTIRPKRMPMNKRIGRRGGISSLSEWQRENQGNGRRARESRTTWRQEDGKGKRKQRRRQRRGKRSSSQ